MNQALKIAMTSFAVTAALIKAAPALAEPSRNVSIVRIADLDLSTKAGRSTLDQRLVIAANEVCGTASDADLAGKNDVRQCRHNALAEARAKTGTLIAGRSAQRVILVASSR
jgi:UrcA family protein